MAVVDIYGHIADESVIIIAVGHYNSVYGLLSYYANEDLLQISLLDSLVEPVVVELVLKYETVGDNICFTLRVKGSNEYIGVKLNEEGKACACIGKEKVYFGVDYSATDVKPRSKLMAGSFYALDTMYAEQKYTVSWKVEGFANGELIIFLPTTWYEKDETSGVCSSHNTLEALIPNLSRVSFKGYTTAKWCETSPHVVNCTNKNACGTCMGRCPNVNHICYPLGSKFVCGPSSAEPDMFHTDDITIAESDSVNTVAWIIIVIIMLIILILVAGLSYKGKIY